MINTKEKPTSVLAGRVFYVSFIWLSKPNIRTIYLQFTQVLLFFIVLSTENSS